MKRVLVTAIGSFSAEYVIKTLKSEDFFILGTDIYPAEWHNISKKCDVFSQVPYATTTEFIPYLLRLCGEFNIKYILPLTDLEIDAINKYRSLFQDKNIKLLIPDDSTLKIARNKLLLSETFDNYNNISIPKFIKSENSNEWGEVIDIDLIAKPIDGRSSEGLLTVCKGKDITFLHNLKNYIVQEMITGQIITVDYVRDMRGKDVAIPRIELLRTKNGAGVTVQIIKDSNIVTLASVIGNKLKIIGCINMEFIYNGNNYYLIDINPRFSAGVAFSSFTGYNMVLNHIKSHCNEEIDCINDYNEMIIEKVYSEVCNLIIK